LNLIVLIVFHQFLLPQPKSRSIAYIKVSGDLWVATADKDYRWFQTG